MARLLDAFVQLREGGSAIRLSPMASCIVDVRTRIDEALRAMAHPEKSELVTRLRHMADQIEKIERVSESGDAEMRPPAGNA